MRRYNLLLVKPAQMVGSRVRKQYKAFFPSITLPTLAALVPPEFDIEIIDESVQQIDFSKYFSIVGITALQNTVDRAISIAKRFKDIWGDKILLVAGGITISIIIKEEYYLTKDYKRNILKYFDHIFIGESDETWPEFLNDFIEKKKREKIIEMKNRPELKNIPLPRTDIIKWSLYSKTPLFRGNFLKWGYLVPIETSRGCPYDCSYCCVTKYWGRQIRNRPVSDVIGQIRKIPKDTFIIFTDDNIAAVPQYAKGLFRAMIKEGIRQKFFAQFTFKSGEDQELLELASKAGCKTAYLGMESMSPNSLVSVKKVVNISDRVKEFLEKRDLIGAKEELKLYYSSVFLNFRMHDINPFPSVIIGLEGDSITNIYKTMQFLLDEKIVMMTQWFYTPLIGSDQFSTFDKNKTLRYKKLGRYDGGYLSVDTEKVLGFLNRDIENAFWDSYQKFYSIPNIYKRIVKNEMSFSEKTDLIVLNLFFYRAVMQRIQPFAMAWRTKWQSQKNCKF